MISLEQLTLKQQEIIARMNRGARLVVQQSQSSGKLVTNLNYTSVLPRTIETLIEYGLIMKDDAQVYHLTSQGTQLAGQFTGDVPMTMTVADVYRALRSNTSLDGIEFYFRVDKKRQLPLTGIEKTGDRNYFLKNYDLPGVFSADADDLLEGKTRKTRMPGMS